MSVNSYCDAIHHECGEPVHHWFGLSYSNYLVLHRSVMQSMPEGWQQRIVVLLEEVAETVADAGLTVDPPGGYLVKARASDGSFIEDRYADYERGRRRVFR